MKTSNSKTDLTVAEGSFEIGSLLAVSCGMYGKSPNGLTLKKATKMK